MDADQFADAPGGGSTGIRCGLYRRHVAADDGGDESGIDLLVADEHDVGGLDHGIRRLDHPHEAACFDEAERLSRKVLCHAESVYYVIRPRAEISSRSTPRSPSTSHAASTRFDTTQEWLGTMRTRSPGSHA